MGSNRISSTLFFYWAIQFFKPDAPPAKCLEGTDAFWMKDPRNGVWIAQKHKTNITTYTSTGNDNAEAAANETNNEGIC